MAINMRFFGNSEAPGTGNGHSVTATIKDSTGANGAATAGTLIIVHAVGGSAGGGLTLPTMSDNGTGTGWRKIGDSTSTSATFRTTKFWKIMAGGETTITVDWTTTGTARAVEAIACYTMGTLVEPYLISEGLAILHFGDMEYGDGDGQGTNPVQSGSGQVYVGCTAIGAVNYSFAAIDNPSVHDNNGVGGDGQNFGATVGVGCIIHINDNAAANLSTDTLKYGSRPTTTTFDSFLGIRASTAASTNVACTTTCNTSAIYTRTVSHGLTAAVSSTVTNLFTRGVNRPVLASVIANVSAVVAARRRRPTPMWLYDDDSD